MLSSSKKKKVIRTIIFTLVTVFIFGVLVGVLVVKICDKFADKSKDEGSNVIVTEQPDVNVTKIYIPDRKRVFGLIPKNSYNTERFAVEDGFMAYRDENGEKISHLGVDLSYHQTSVDWDKLKNSGVEFVMLRCGYRGYSEGGLVEDEKFREYAQACNDYGIPMGVYFFSQAVNASEARKEAEFVVELIEDYDISYPVAYDTEVVQEPDARTNADDITDEMRTQMCIEFCKVIEEAGYYPMIYASENRLRRDLIISELSDYDIWAPQYYEENDFLYDFTIWQYSEKGFIPGIDEEVDLNISLVDYADFVPDLRKKVTENAEVIPISTDSISFEDGLEGNYVISSNAPALEIDLPINTEGGAAKPEW